MELVVLIFVTLLFAAVVSYFFIVMPIKNTVQEIKARKNARERVNNMSEEEKEELIWGDFWKNIYGSLPKRCPRCSTANYEKDEIGYPSSKWEIKSKKTVEIEKLDKAYRFGGATTVFTKKETKEVVTYKCPQCDYTHTIG